MPAAVETDFELFTSMRYDPRLTGHPENNKYSANTTTGSPLYMFRLHRDRMMLAAKYFEWHAAVAKLSDLALLEAEVLASVGEYEAAHGGGKALKLRLLITATGKFTTACSGCGATSLLSLYPTSLSPGYSTDEEDFAVPNAPWPVAVDPHLTPKTGYTRWKTTVRHMYDSARLRVGIESPAAPKEVLLQNELGELTEGSYTSCFFLRDGRWVTPPVSSGGQEGTTRRWALENGLAVEEVVLAASLKEGEGVWVSNGVKGCVWGRVTLAPPLEPAMVTTKVSMTITKPVAAAAAPSSSSSSYYTTSTAAGGAAESNGISRKSSRESSSSGPRSSSDYRTRDWLSDVHHAKEKPTHEVKSIWKEWILS